MSIFMKRILFLSLLCIFLLANVGFAQIGTELQKRLDKARNNELLPVIVAYKEQFDVTKVTHNYRIRGDVESVKTQVIQILKTLKVRERSKA